MGQKIIIPDERPPSWNKFYAGMHWAERRAEGNRVKKLVRAFIDPERAQLLDQRADVEVIVYFAHHPQDPDNICSKVYIDGIKGIVIEDDTREHVRSVTTRSEIDKEQPRVEILIKETE